MDLDCAFTGVEQDRSKVKVLRNSKLFEFIFLFYERNNSKIYHTQESKISLNKTSSIQVLATTVRGRANNNPNKPKD
jgi:predicted DNA-binding ArsR family transcriptional regulator